MIDLIYSIALLVQAPVPSPATSVHTDGHGPAPLQEFAATYDCGDIRAAIRYRLERRQSPDPAGGLVRRVTLLGMTINGRTLPDAHLERVSDLFRSAAELDVVGSNCENGHIEIRVTTVSPAAWADFLEGRTAEADERFWSIRLSARGLVDIR